MINKNRGFTLIETLGAVMLLSIALVGPMVIAQKGLQTSLIAKDQNSAFNIAQDAVEFIRFARDTNCLVASASALSPCPATGAVNWLAGNGNSAQTVDLTRCISVDTLGTTACYVDSVQSTVTSCASGICPVVNYDSSNNYFTYSAVGGAVSSTIFTRTIQIKTYDASCSGVCNQNEADLIVTVSWNDPLAHSIVVNETLYDWQ